VLNSEKYFYFNTIFLILFLCNNILEACKINNETNIITKYVDFVLQLFFTINILFKLVNYEDLEVFILTLDFITNLSGYLSFAF
jgi:hypothetical protein